MPHQPARATAIRAYFTDFFSKNGRNPTTREAADAFSTRFDAMRVILRRLTLTPYVEEKWRKSTALTARQEFILRYVIRYIDDHGFAPGIREIAAHADIESTFGVTDHLHALEKKGYLTWARGKSRAITVLKNLDGTPRGAPGGDRYATHTVEPLRRCRGCGMWIVGMGHRLGCRAA